MNVFKAALEESMKPWYDWNDRVGSKMVDLGAPTAGAQIMQGADNWSTKSTVASGYSIVQAKDLEDLKALLVNHPHTAWSNETSIEVHECVAM